MSDIEYPVAVVGGALVGSAFALALAHAGVPVQVFDGRRPLGGDDAAQLRPIALSVASVRILTRLGLWDAIAPRAQPILSVHVSMRGRFGRVRMRAAEHHLDALGHVTDAATIQAALAHEMPRQPLLRMHPATPVQGVRPHHEHVHLDIAGREHGVCAGLLVMADGAASRLGAGLDLGSTHHDYAQQAVVCNVSVERAHLGVAYERFLDGGPLALLPLVDGRCGLVWSVPQSRGAALAELDDGRFLSALSDAFGHRLGRFTAASARHCFPLGLTRARRLYTHRSVCIGNAANQLHPVAGQGLNLGLRDAATLAELVALAHQQGMDPGDPSLLSRYAELRRADHRRVVRFTDLLARGFTIGPRWLGGLRSAALMGLQLTPPARTGLARMAMGLQPPLPRAARCLEP